MKIVGHTLVGYLVVAMCALPTAMGASKTELAQAMSHDGLRQTKVKGLDLVYVRPGATLAGYSRVRIDPIEVAFRKDWNPTKPDSRLRLSAEEREEIRMRTAQIVREEFVSELQGKGQYQVVDASGPDVLRVRVSIIDLYVTAPNAPLSTPLAGGARTYAVSSGEMTIFAELFDSETGSVIARIVDRREARRVSGMMSLTTGARNVADGRDIASHWARILRNGLDAARGIGKK
jgi:hypothetical protein